MARDSVTCSLKLRHVTENRYVKCPVHFFGWNIFHLLSYEQNLLTNRIAGKLMKTKKIKLLGNDTKMQSLISNRYDALDNICKIGEET